jgi:hypothetical protein
MNVLPDSGTMVGGPLNLPAVLTSFLSLQFSQEIQSKAEAIWCQCYKTFYGRKLRLFIKS